jgi:hypothetical protein
MPHAAAPIPNDASSMSLAERVACKVATNEPLTKQELKFWKGWSDSTIDRYTGHGMPVSRRPRMRDHFTPSKVNGWLGGDEPQRPVPRRGRPRNAR